MQTPFYNTQHAPVGAFASFTLGAKGAKGGLDLERAAPACENFWIGCEDRTGTTLQVLPFCEASPEPEKAFGKEPETPSRLPLHFFEPNEIQRNLTPGCDAWNTEDFHFSIYTQAPRLPNPDLEDSAELREGLVPAVLCEIRLDNRHGHTKRRVVFAWQGNHPQTIMRCMDAGSVVGIAQGMDRGFFGATGTWVAGQGMHVEEILEAVRQMDLQTLRHSIGSVGALIAEVPAGGVSVFHLVAAFFRNGPATTDKRFRYWYLHWWDSIEDVAAFALSSSDALIKAAHTANKLLGGQNLSLPRRWMLAQAVHSYYACTELLEDHERNGESFWIVNEGEYRMMNTLDLVVDHFFFDMRRHPWAVRSILERYRREFSYSDRWGLTFQHDMGVANTFATSGHSAYELPKRQGCFSFMCQEELVNWILAAVLYTKLSNDIDWLHDQRKTMDQCMASLIARDNTDKRHSIGLMQHDSDRCEGGWEITTYDSMDFCLGRACGNLYLGVKTWAAWLALEWHYELWEQPEAAQKVRSYAQRAHDTLCASFNSQTGIFPAQLDGACGGAVLPAVEGLIFPWYLAGKRMLADDYPYAKLIQLLRQHAQTVLQSRCRFKDGGWKLSESAENSWLSKIYLSQAIISGILGYSDPQEKQADLAHQSWLLDEENSVFAWSDQMRAGKVCGSRNYPRGVTATLWLELE